MIAAILSGVRALLIADSAITTALGGQRVYSLLAPESATMPYVILQITGGGDDNLSQTAGADVMVSVLCVADTDAGGASAASGVADRVRAVLHDALPTLSGGWVCYRCQHQSVVLYTETEDRTTYAYAGGTYRVRAYKT